MSTYYDKTKSSYRFTFNRVIDGKQVRATKLLPKTWSPAQVDSFDIKETARIYAEATGITKSEKLIEDAILIFIEEVVPELKARDDYIREFKNLYYLYAGVSISELHTVCAEINKLTWTSKKSGSIPKLLSAATRRNKIRYITSACNYAFKHHNFGDHRPSERVVIPTVNNNRLLAPSRSDMVSIARTLSRGSARAALICAFYSGMRQGEILRTKQNKGVFILADTKNGLPRYVPIHPKLNVYLNRFPILTPAHIIYTEFRKAKKLAGLSSYTFHDFRHGSATEMINNGVDLHTVGKVLGHKSPISTQRYAHLAVDTLRNAINKIGKTRSAH